jgi:hypothetical protein
MQLLAGEVVEADARMQVSQRLAWRAFRQAADRGIDPEMARWKGLGIDLTEGLDRLGNLGFGEVRVDLRLEPVKRTLLHRYLGPILRFFGGAVPPAGAFRLAPGAAGEAITVSLVVTRAPDGSRKAKLESQAGISPEDVYVSRLLA